MKAHRLFILLVLGMTWAGCGEKIEPPPTPSIPSMPAPHFELSDLDGNKVSSDSFLGKIVIVNFWASWSPGCVREIPEWIALQSEFEKKGVIFVGINVDREGAAVARPYADKRSINYLILLGDMDLGTDFGGLDGIPTTFVIDREWNLVNRYTGMTSAASIRSEIHALLNLDRIKAKMAGSATAMPVSKKKAGEEGPDPYAPKAEEKKESAVEEVPVPVEKTEAVPAGN